MDGVVHGAMSRTSDLTARTLLRSDLGKLFTPCACVSKRHNLVAYRCKNWEVIDRLWTHDVLWSILFMIGLFIGPN